MVEFLGLCELFFPEMRILIPETWKTSNCKRCLEICQAKCECLATMLTLLPSCQVKIANEHLDPFKEFSRVVIDSSSRNFSLPADVAILSIFNGAGIWEYWNDYLKTNLLAV